MKTVNNTATKENHVAPFLKIAGVSSLYRYISNGNFYMIARINGKLVKESLETTDLALAKRKILDAKDRRRQQTGEITLSQLAAEFKASRNGKNQKHIQWMINKLSDNCPFAHSNIRKINPIEISKYVSSLKLNSRSNNLLFETLKGVFELGVIGGYIQINPMEKLKKSLRKKVTRKIPNVPSLEQFSKIIQTIRNQKFSDTANDSANLVKFLGLAALGEAEAANLDWKDIDFTSGKINVQRQKTKVHFQIPIYPPLKPFLLELHEKADSPKSGKVFKVNNPKKAIASACKVLGYHHFTSRNFRQMGIVELLRNGIPVKLVSKWQGHRDGGVLIMNTYSQVISETDSDYEKEQLQRLEVK